MPEWGEFCRANLIVDLVFGEQLDKTDVEVLFVCLLVAGLKHIVILGRSWKSDAFRHQRGDHQ